MNETVPFDQASQSLGKRLSIMLGELDIQTKSQTQEIRLRSESKIVLRINNELKTLEHFPIITSEQIREAFECICGYSVYAHQQEIAEGYVTVQGGHRAGICGTAVIKNGQAAMLRNISSINLRIARSFTGCSAQLFSQIDFSTPCGILVAGSPMSGKTTLLRDVAASLSSGRTGRRYAVSILDERGELAACCAGAPQYEAVRCCDVLSGYPKGEAISSAIRSMSPEIIICDEIGTVREAEEIREGINAGVSVIASVHAGSEKELILRPVIRTLIETCAFKYIVLLSEAPMSVKKVIKAEDLKNENTYMFAGDASFSDSGKRISNGYKAQIRVA